MMHKLHITPNKKLRQSGNIFFMLIGAVALIGAMTVAGGNTVRGIVTSMSEVTRKTVAEEKMQAAARLSIQSAVNCDTDTPSDFTEPVAWRDPGALPHPTGGGLLPETIGATLKDPWGTEYGYCAWNLGNGVCTDSPNRLAGGDDPANTVVAIISAGKDRRFSSTCGNTGGGSTPADCAGLGDAHYNDPVSGHCYFRTSANTYNWDDAQAECAANGGYLATITSSAEQATIAANIPLSIMWIGIRSPAEDGNWSYRFGELAGTSFWTGGNGGSVVGAAYNNWDVGQPEGYEFCGTLGDLGFPEWHDWPCSYVGHRALCEIPAGGSGNPGVVRDDGSDDLVFEYTYNDAIGLGGDDLWRIIDTRPGTAGIDRDIAVAGGADLTGPLNLMRAGLILPGDDVTGPCSAATDQQLRINFSMNPAVLEICDFAGGNGWTAVSMGDGGGGGGGGSAPTAGLVAYWPFTDSGTAGVDASGNGHDSIWGFGGDTYEISWTAGGHIGGGAISDGSPDLMVAAGGPDFNLSSYTLSAWVRPEATWAAMALIVGKTGNGRRNYGLYYQNNGSIVCEHGINNNAGTFDTVAPSAIPMSQWSHVACTYDDTSKEMSIYVDGLLQVSYTGTSTPDFSTEDLWIGWDEGRSNYPLFGIVDEVRVYNRALAPAEITDVYNDGGSGDAPEIVLPDTFLIHPQVNMCTSAAPGPLVKVGESDNSNYYREINMTTDYMFVAGYDSGIHAFRRNLDGSVTRLHTIGGGTVTGVHYDGTYVYAANMYGNLVAYSFNGTTLTQVGTISTPGLSIDVKGDDNYLYVADDEAIRAYTFNGTTFTLAGEFAIAGNGATHVWTDGAFIYLSAQGNGLFIMTFNGTAFTEVARIDPPQHVGWSFGDGRYLYVHETWGMGIYTFDGTTATRVGQYDPDTGSPLYSGFTDGKNLYFGLEDSGTLVVARFNGAYVEVLNIVSAPSRVYSARSDGNLLYVGTNTGRMQVYSGVGCGGESSTPAGIANPAVNMFDGKISSSLSHSCGIKPDGSAWCWGRGTSGELGIGSTPASVASPLRINDANGYRQIAAGSYFTCGIRIDGTAWCWGEDGSGQLGNGTLPASTSPSPVAGGRRWIKIDADSSFACGIDSDADLYCWGNNSNGQLGRGSIGGNFNSPQLVSGNIKWRDVAIGGVAACGIDDLSRLWCWGDNTDGRLGSGELSLGINVNAPILVRDTGPWEQVSVGMGTTCGIKADGSLWCWGRGTDCGTAQPSRCGITTSSPEPVAEPGPWALVSLARGAVPVSGCAIKQDGTTWCWGRTTTGHLGNNVASTTNRNPRQMTDPGPWAHIQMGAAYTCGIKRDGSAWCWGGDTNGRLGNGSVLTANQLIPSRVVGWPNRAAWLWDETGRNISAAGSTTTNIALGTGVMGYAASGVTHNCAGLGNSHYNDPATGHCYYKVNTAASWNDAENACKANGGYLAVITSNEEQTKIQAAFGTADQVWLGGSDGETEGEWRFIGGEYDRELFWLGGINGTPQNGFYNNWYAGMEPNNVGGDQHCLSMYYTQWPLWDDAPCSAALRYICEIGTAGAGGGLSFPAADNTLLRQYSGGSEFLLETGAANSSAQVAWGITGGGNSRAMGISHTTGELVLGLTNSAMTNWINSITPQLKVSTDGRVGVGVTGSVFTKLDINGGLRIGNDMGVCNVMREGTLRYVGGTTPFEYCNGTAWTPL